MSDINALNAQYGIPGQITFLEGPGGLTLADIVNAHASARIALQGAQVMTWAPRQQGPVIWLSPAAKFGPGKSIRGGVPVCWPWFGPHATQSSLPAHGYARTTSWQPVETRALANGDSFLVFRLAESEATRAQWPHATPVECRITIGAALTIELVTRNEGREPVTLGEALHTYFAVSDIRQVAVRGLAGCAYLDKVDGGKRKQQDGAVTFSGETDRIYLDTTADCLIDDPGMKRRIRIAKRGSHSTVVWNPWIEKADKMGDLGENGYLKMLCVESANAADNVLSIAPGAEHRLWVGYTIEPLA